MAECSGITYTYGVVPPYNRLSRTTATPATKMLQNSNTGSTIFQADGKLKPGIYKIQNIVGKTYVDIKDDVRELCGKTSTALEDGRGQVSLRLGLPPTHLTTNSGKSSPSAQDTRSGRSASTPSYAFITSPLNNDNIGWAYRLRKA